MRLTQATEPILGGAQPGQDNPDRVAGQSRQAPTRRRRGAKTKVASRGEPGYLKGQSTLQLFQQGQNAVGKCKCVYYVLLVLNVLSIGSETRNTNSSMHVIKDHCMA